jgi:hypothetical protein
MGRRKGSSSIERNLSKVSLEPERHLTHHEQRDGSSSYDATYTRDGNTVQGQSTFLPLSLVLIDQLRPSYYFYDEPKKRFGLIWNEGARLFSRNDYRIYVLLKNSSLLIESRDRLIWE